MRANYKALVLIAAIPIAAIAGEHEDPADGVGCKITFINSSSFNISVDIDEKSVVFHPDRRMLFDNSQAHSMAKCCFSGPDKKVVIVSPGKHTIKSRASWIAQPEVIDCEIGDEFKIEFDGRANILGYGKYDMTISKDTSAKKSIGPAPLHPEQNFQRWSQPNPLPAVPSEPVKRTESSDSVSIKLKKIKLLYTNGLINKEEYDTSRKQILKKYVAGTEE
jgi:hypothetical protein